MVEVDVSKPGHYIFRLCLGYQLCRQRLRRKDIHNLDLRAWRLAAVGSETNNPETMILFAEALAPAGFNEKDLLIINGRSVWPQDLEKIAEQQPEVRTGDAVAIVAPDENGRETAVLLLQCRKPELAKQSGLKLLIQGLINRRLGLDCKIELVSRHTLPRTTSGKLARAKARQEYINRMARTTKTVRYAGV